MSRDLYQQMSPNINLLATRATFAPLEHKRLAWSFVTFADPEPMLPLMRYINFERAAEADFIVGGRTLHDVRARLARRAVRRMVGQSLRALAVHRAGWRGRPDRQR